MTKPLNIQKHYQKLVSTLSEARLDENLTNDLYSEVYASKWVKIFLSGNIDSNEVEIQIEILVPILSPQELKSGISKDYKERKMSFLLSTQIEPLEYLLELHKNNEFKLDIIKEEGIWFGIKKLETEPTEKLLSCIMPPKISPEKFKL